MNIPWAEPSKWRVVSAIRDLKRRGLRLRMPAKLDMSEVKRLRESGLSYPEIARIVGRRNQKEEVTA